LKSGRTPIEARIDNKMGKIRREVCQMTINDQNAPHESVSKVKTRIFYMDNIRVYLTVLVILHHLAVGYGGSGGWAVYEADFRSIDALTTIIFTLFNAINQAYFMAFFFLLAGYFTPRSYEKKGSMAFFKDRLIRLGIPLVVYAIFISPVVAFITLNYAYNLNISLIDIYIDRIRYLVLGVDHLWFLQALLIFAGIYVTYQILNPQKRSSEELKTPYLNKFPTDKAIITLIGVLALITFSIRIFVLVGTTIIFNFQFAHFASYGFCFWLGILAYRGKWFANLPDSQAKRWIGITGLVLVALPMILLLFVDLNNPDFYPFFGGVTAESLVYSVWESIALLAFTISVLYIFQTKLNGSNKIVNNMAGSAYTAYIIHAFVIITLMILFLPLEVAAYIKFIIVALIGIPLIFGLSSLIRKIPYFSHVLG
jgi:hypothetical protein